MENFQKSTITNKWERKTITKSILDSNENLPFMISQPNCAKALTNRKWAEITKDSEFQINKSDWKLWKVLIHNLGEEITQDQHNF